MWTLDPVNSPLLIRALSQHWRGVSADIAWVGEGWRALVEQCHSDIAQRFPDYELLNIKQKHGVLAFQANPRPCIKSGEAFTAHEVFELDAIVGKYVELSTRVCEFCGRRAKLREGRTLELTLCDTCEVRFDDPPQPGTD